MKTENKLQAATGQIYEVVFLEKRSIVKESKSLNERKNFF